MRYLVPLGRILFALIFITAAPRHFTQEGVHHAAELGVPFAAVLVPVSGLMAFLGGLSIATGYKVHWGMVVNRLSCARHADDARLLETSRSCRRARPASHVRKERLDAGRRAASHSVWRRCP